MEESVGGVRAEESRREILQDANVCDLDEGMDQFLRPHGTIGHDGLANEHTQEDAIVAELNALLRRCKTSSNWFSSRSA
jgi:hypothetical protein